MTAFAIDQFDHLDDDGNDLGAELEVYIDTLREQFNHSPEAQPATGDDDEPGGWIAPFIDMGYRYLGVTLTQMDTNDVDEIVNELFVRKVSINSEDEIASAIPELTAFWQFLKREYQLPNADAILGFLSGAGTEFKQRMNDPANFDPAKAFFMAGKAAGYDMTTHEGISAFQEVYNASLPPPGMLDDDDDFLPVAAPAPISAQERAKKKRLRKQAKASRKKNRQRKK